MKRFSHIVATGLAIFAMFFGAGNFMYSIQAGVQCGGSFASIIGFLLSAVCLPLIGLVGMMLFDGNYKDFFNRLGAYTGTFFIAICLIIIGPLIAIPRITTLSHTMLKPFIPIHFLQEETLLASFVFALIFFSLTFICTYKESRVVDLLGYVISPLKIGALIVIIAKGLWYAVPSKTIDIDQTKIFTTNLLRGYETLDLLAAIFFAYVILTILKKAHYELVNTPKKRALLCLQSGAIGLSILALVYTGMILLGYYYGPVIAQGLDAGQMFREIALYILGPQGGFLIAVAIVVACLSTAIALTATFSEYLKNDIFSGKITYVQALLITFALCLPLSTFGLGQVLRLTGGPIVFIGYPVLIALTVCNIAYKLVGFKFVKAPVALTLVIATLIYYSSSLIG